MNRFNGSCHCGNLEVVLESARAAGELPVRACGCSFCRAHGALSTSDPAGRIHFRARDESRLNRYRFGLKTADFWICKECGIYIGAVMATDEGAFAIVNVRVLADAEAFGAPAPMHYDAENADGRLARRARNWSPFRS